MAFELQWTADNDTAWCLVSPQISDCTPASLLKQRLCQGEQTVWIVWIVCHCPLLDSTRLSPTSCLLGLQNFRAINLIILYK